jgi:hypothetical protein
VYGFRCEAPWYSSVLTIDKMHRGWIKNSSKLKFLILYGGQDPPPIKRFGEIYADLLRKRQFWAEFWISITDDHFSVIDSLAEKDSDVSRKLKSFIFQECFITNCKL